MLKRTIKYKDFDGNPASGEYYFNLTKTELVELEASYDGGLEARIRRIVASEDSNALVGEFKKIILAAYGKRDGDRFVKNDQLREEFTQTAAYDSLFIELAIDDKAAAEFIQGILPDDLPEAEKEDQDKPKPPPLPNPVRSEG